MTELLARIEWRGLPTTVVALLMVAGGVLLAGVSQWFLLLVPLGMFGPGALRELGWLGDHDEFQRQAARRAGYHAFLASGLVAGGIAVWLRAGGTPFADPLGILILVVALLWFSWFLSWLVSYWGSRPAASRLLVAMGCLWLVLAVATNTGSEWVSPTTLALHLLLPLPFFLLAWTALRWPRTTGVALLAYCALFLGYTGLLTASNLDLATRGVVLVLFAGPLLASAIALVATRGENE
jgi:hypothetical protein